MDELVDAPITLVVAPAGAGKTSMLADWTDHTSMPTAWLSLDDTDRDGAQLWTGLVAALDGLVPGCGEGAAPLFRRPDKLLDAVGRLVDDLDADDHPPAILVVDDLQLADDDDVVAQSLALFLLHVPSRLHLVLLSRREPRLPLDRLRARGQLREIRFSELRFSPDEAREMVTRLVPTLSADQVATAVSRAQGWAAGLHLGAIAARTAQARPDAELPPRESDLMVEDYVRHEVLGAEDPALAAALSDIAVVDRINPSLARALTGRRDADALLEWAEARGLFVARVDASGWFGVHALVREVLLADLSRRAPDRLAELHARAARWFEEADEVPLALEHWLHAQLPREALRLLAAKNAELYDAGRATTITRTITAIPVRVATADFESMLDYAWCQVLVDRRRFLRAVDQLTWWADQSPAPTPVLAARLTMLRSIAATTKGDWAAGGELARRALDGLRAGWWRDPLGKFGWNLVARAAALDERWDDTHDDIRDADLGSSRDPERRLAFEGTRALGEALAGRPAHAVRVAAGVRRSAAGAGTTLLSAELAVAEALAHRELGDRSRAVGELLALVDAPLEPVPYCRVLALLDLAEAWADEGDLDAAHDAFGHAEGVVELDLPGRGGRTWLARTGIRLALAADQVEAARRWSNQLHDPFWGGVGEARVLLAEGNRVDAAAALEVAVPRCVRHEVVRDLLRSRATDDDAALKHAAAAAELAAANAMVQSVAAEGAAILDLVEHAAWQVPRGWLDRVRRAAAGVHGAEPPVGGPPHLALTRRERDVLRFLPSRLTIREIADELYVSVNTVKFHLKVIYRKLGVQSRAEAAERARAMTAISR
ncbi:MAG TPA: LuxR C-terminal-related transcriptional regulator [Jiangellaceae bacterium]